MHLKIKQLSIDERPYEKYLKYGVESLSDSELIAVLLKNGTKEQTSIEIAREVIKKDDFTSSLSCIYTKSFDELKRIKGIGSVKAITLKCVAEIARRISVSDYTKGYKFDTPSVIADYYMESLRFLPYETFYVLYLNSSNCSISSKIISKGIRDQALVSVQEVMRTALMLNAANLVLIHNHPSGNPVPSEEDISITERFIKSANLLELRILDHIIIGDKKYISFRECNLVF